MNTTIRLTAVALCLTGAAVGGAKVAYSATTVSAHKPVYPADCEAIATRSGVRQSCPTNGNPTFKVHVAVKAKGNWLGYVVRCPGQPPLPIRSQKFDYQRTLVVGGKANLEVHQALQSGNCEVDLTLKFGAGASVADDFSFRAPAQL